jgi:hypothetical protein
MAEWQTFATEVVTGGTQNLPATNELPVDMHSKQFTTFPGLTPLTVILGRLNEDPAFNFRIDWQEENEIPTVLQVGTALASGGTALVVTGNGNTARDNSLLFSPRTFELFAVNGNPSSDTAITVVGAQGGTSNAALVSGDILHVLPPAIPETDTTVRAISVQASNVFNYISILKMQYQITRLMDRMRTHFGGAGSKRDELKQQKWREVRKKKEKLLMFGGRATQNSALTIEYQSGGLVHYLRNGTLYKDFNGIFTETGFDNYIGDYFDQNPDAQQVMYFCSPNIRRLMSEWGKDKVRISPDSKKFGFRIDTYVAGNIDVNIVTLPLLVDPVTKGWAWILDMQRMRLKVIDPLTFFPDALTVGESETILDTYRGVDSLLIGSENHHSMMVGALI